MKRIIMLAAAATLALGLASAPASAQSTPTTTTTTPTTATTPTPPPTCVGNACTPQAPRNTTFQVSGEALFGGFGHSVFEGKEGYNVVEKQGEGGIDITIAGQGGLCNFNCEDGNVRFTGFARETVTVNTGALGNESGKTVSAINQGGAAGMLRFNFQSGPAPATVPAPAAPSGH